MTEKQEKFLAISQGGMGKQIALTAALKAFRQQHPDAKIHVQSTFPDIFQGLSCIDRHFGLPCSNSYFAEDHSGFEILQGEPYYRLPYRHGEEHIVAAICRLWGCEPPQNNRGFLKVFDEEDRTAWGIVKEVDRGKKWVAFQPFGGTPYYQSQEAKDTMRSKQVRDLPFDVAKQIADKLHDLGYIVIQISLPTERRLNQSVIWLDPGGEKVYHPRIMIALLNLCDGFIGIDSFGQHAWTALGKRNGIVLWGGTRPESLGYPENRNLSIEACPRPHCSRPDILGDMVGAQAAWRCEFDKACMAHSPDRVIAELEEANGWDRGCASRGDGCKAMPGEAAKNSPQASS